MSEWRDVIEDAFSEEAHYHVQRVQARTVLEVIEKDYCLLLELKRLLAETFDHVKACHGCIEHSGTPESDLDKRILKAIGRG